MICGLAPPTICQLLIVIVMTLILSQNENAALTTVRVETSWLPLSTLLGGQEKYVRRQQSGTAMGFLILALLICACVTGHALKTVFAGLLLE